MSNIFLLTAIASIAVVGTISISTSATWKKQTCSQVSDILHTKYHVIPIIKSSLTLIEASVVLIGPSTTAAT